MITTKLSTTGTTQCIHKTQSSTCISLYNFQCKDLRHERHKKEADRLNTKHESYRPSPGFDV